MTANASAGIVEACAAVSLPYPRKAVASCSVVAILIGDHARVRPVRFLGRAVGAARIGRVQGATATHARQMCTRLH